MKVYTITDRQLREFVRVIGEEAQRPLLELIENVMRELRALVADLAEPRDELSPVDRNEAPPVAPRR